MEIEYFNCIHWTHRIHYFPPSSPDKTQLTPGPRFGDVLGNKHKVSSTGCWMRQKRLGSWSWTFGPRGRTRASCPRGSVAPASWSWPPPSPHQPRVRPGWARGWSRRARGGWAGTGQAQDPPHLSGPGSTCPRCNVKIVQNQQKNVRKCVNLKV